jgi:hypothetical protein
LAILWDLDYNFTNSNDFRGLWLLYLLVWHIVGYIYDLFAAESLVRNTIPNYPTNYKIVSWENFSCWICWLIIIKKSSLISDKLKLKFCFGWQSPMFTRQVLCNSIYQWFIPSSFPCQMGPSHSCFINVIGRNCSEQFPN